MSLLRQSSSDQMNRIVNQIHKEIGGDIGEVTAGVGSNSANFIAIKNPINRKIDTYDKFTKRDNRLQTRAFVSKHVNKPIVKKMLDGSQKIKPKGNANEGSRYILDLDTKDVKLAGNSEYPVGTKIKFKDEGRELTGTLTHPFGFCQGDVGVILDETGIFQDDRCCLRNHEYTVIDPEMLNDVDKFKKNRTFKRFDL